MPSLGPEDVQSSELACFAPIQVILSRTLELGLDLYRGKIIVGERLLFTFLPTNNQDQATSQLPANLQGGCICLKNLIQVRNP